MISKKQSGFTLIELAVVMTIIGIIMGSMITGIKVYLDMRQESSTREKLNVIADALSAFAQTYGRLPCPGLPSATTSASDPYGSPRNTGTGGTLIMENSCGGGASNLGIVPYKALGLDYTYSKDAYGNVITYAASRALVVDPMTAIDVHASCRLPRWISGGVNLNRRKAAVCCASGTSNNDVKVYNDKNLTYLVFAGVHSTSSSDYASPNTAATSTNNENKFIAFILVSHGANGDGAYIANTSSTRPNTALATAQEAENRNGDSNFVDRAISKADTDDYFDDIVVWRTNEQLISAFGNDSCAGP
jgi:prepilin-type N-terminal cleavage/methylation domain-containing protein